MLSCIATYLRLTVNRNAVADDPWKCCLLLANTSTGRMVRQFLKLGFQVPPLSYKSLAKTTFQTNVINASESYILTI